MLRTTMEYTMDNRGRRELIGEGRFGYVWKGDRTEDGVIKQRIAIKTMKQGQLESAVNERKILEYIHESGSPETIIAYYGVLNSSYSVGICIELMDKTLEQWVQEEAAKSTVLSVSDKVIDSNTYRKSGTRFIYDASTGLSYLHRKDVLHGDLKLSNILINSDGRAKLADFGSSKMKDDRTVKAHEGTLAYLAPELLINHTDEKNSVPNSVSTPTDIYSLAIVMAEVSCRTLFNGFGIDNADFAVEICKHKKRMPLDDCPDAIKPIITAAWDADPKQRPAADIIATQLEGYLQTIMQPVDISITPENLVNKKALNTNVSVTGLFGSSGSTNVPTVTSTSAGESVQSVNIIKNTKK